MLPIIWKAPIRLFWPALWRQTCLRPRDMEATPFPNQPVKKSAHLRLSGCRNTFSRRSTQTNATVIRGLLHSYEGVIAAGSGHISVHEAGAIELGGHKVLTLPMCQENSGSGYRRPDWGLQKRRKQRTYGHARHGLHLTANGIRYAVFAQ